MQSKKLALLIAFCHILGMWKTVATEQNQNWQEPNSWAKEIASNYLQEETLDNGFCKCSGGESIDASSSNNQAALMIFTKFIKILFNREKLEYDHQFALYQRELIFTVLPHQLEKLEKLTDPRDLDTVLIEVFENARTPNKYNHSSGIWSSIFALIWDILNDIVMLLRFSEVKFLLVALIFVMFAWFIKRRHNVGIVLVIVIGFFIVGYIVTYMECNRELEINQMLDVIERNEPTKLRWYTPFSNWLYGDSKSQNHRERLMKESKLNFAFCLPDYVLMKYLNKIFFMNLQCIIEKCIETLDILNSRYWMPYSIFASIALIFLIGYTLKLTFKYILNPSSWVGYYRQSQNSENISHQKDPISNENLRKLLEAVKPTNIYISNSTLSCGSCVQDLPSQSLEALKEISDNSDNISSKSSNVSISEETILKSESNLQQKSSSNNNLEKEESSDKSENDFVLISELDSKGKSIELIK